MMTTDNTDNLERTQRTIRPQEMIREKQAVLEEDIQQPVLQQQQQQQQAGGKICPFCGAVNEPEAMFCAQCGHPISKSSCPFCGAEVDPDADFCEACHRYIRKDICSYCGAKLKGNEAYCPECGSPRGGLVCPTCHTLNDFAFCKKCGTALTAEAKEMLKELQKNPDYKAVIMENHGVVLMGEDIADAYQRFETLELCARTILNAKTLGEPKFLTEEQILRHEQAINTNLRPFMNVKYPSDERAIRTEICEIVHRACAQGLMCSSYGTASVRWRGDDFLITPSDKQRWELEPNDIVQVRNGMVEAGKNASRSTALHYEIYRRNPKINSIILTQTPYLMGYATTGVKFDVRTIPESWIFLQDVPRFPFGSQYDNLEGVAEEFKTRPCVLLENDSVIVTGDKLINTFDRLEVADFSARSLIMAAPVGKLHPINDEQVEDLRKAFHVGE